MSAPVDALILEQLQAVRADLSRMSGDVAELRNEMAELRASLDVVHAEADPVAAVRRLWNEGLASGIAGDLDDVVDEVLSQLPRTKPAS